MQSRQFLIVSLILAALSIGVVFIFAKYVMVSRNEGDIGMLGKAINPYFAEKIFKGIARELEVGIKFKA